MPYFRTVITTNWDRYFEEETSATPFVYETDVPLWAAASRPLLKIHGSIDNYASLVASQEDYRACEARLRDGAIGAVLKQIFATKTCVFVGYSATDPDFLAIYRTVMQGIGRLARAHYLVSPFTTDAEANHLRDNLGILSIRTDATYFLETVKERMVEKNCYAPDRTYGHIFSLWLELRDIHSRFVASYKPVDAPQLIFCMVYQDGLMHAFEKIIDQRKTGKYSDLHHVRRQASAYEAMLRDYRRKRDYWETSYFTGYWAGLIHFDMIATLPADDVPQLPMYFHPGVDMVDEEEFEAQ